jgi:photosystem II stability/assembly factor-like uncharacterized protein
MTPIDRSVHSSQVDPALLQDLRWRCIGPPRGGRTGAVVGHPTEPAVFYFGTCAGGVWKSDDAGTHWQNISDGDLTSCAIGAIAIAESDPNVIYIGTGETAIRADISYGDGVYKSVDGGSSWQHVGLADTHHIGKIRIHPADANLLYVAALGHVFGPNAERGVFRSADGGDTWEKILYRSDKAGATDLAMSPTNPRVLFAAIWETNRTFWALSSGGPDSGLHRSVDGGDTWVEIGGNPGLPSGIIGKIGVAVSAVRPDRVWAIIEAEKGGLFRSDDGGDSWQLICDKRELLGRPFYYCHVYADPQDADTVYVLDFKMWKSTDGGATFTEVNTPHGDNQDLWIDPRNPQRMIEGNDGGACVSFNGGNSWTTIFNQLTSQFYRIDVDGRFPYCVYGTQQDNSSIGVPSASEHGAITWSQCFPAGTGESGDVAVDPADDDIVYIGAIGSSPGGMGVLQRFNRRTKEIALVSVWPEEYFGRAPKDLKYRFNWTFPITFSPHDSSVLYVAANAVFRTTDGGDSWTAISPDLTRDDPTRQEASGGPITTDVSGAETYCTIYAFAESPVEAGVLWAGSDDGLIHTSRDGGDNWKAVTPPDMPAWTLVSCIEPSCHDGGTAYVAATRYKLDDYDAYLYKTTNYGDSWTVISDAFPKGEISRVVREDGVRPGLLFVGTETGIFFSADAGDSWSRLDTNLPLVPVYDLKVKGADLIAGTHGRSFWILDDISPLRSLIAADAKEGTRLLPPAPAYRRWVNWMARGPQAMAAGAKANMLVLGAHASFNDSEGENGEWIRTVLDGGEDRPLGAVIYYLLKEEPSQPITLSILDAGGEVINEYTSRPTEEADAQDEDTGEEKQTLFAPARKGLNRFVWDMRCADARRSVEDSPMRVKIEPIAAQKPGRTGACVAPGRYQVQLKAGEAASSVERLEIHADPRLDVTTKDLEAQANLCLRIRDKLSELNEAIDRLRRLQRQALETATRVRSSETVDTESEGISKAARELANNLEAIEAELTQIDLEGSSDALRIPVKLNGMLSGLIVSATMGDGAPTKSMLALFEDLSAQLDKQLSNLQAIVDGDVVDFNKLVEKSKLPAVSG